jgi:hypothetical protein
MVQVGLATQLMTRPGQVCGVLGWQNTDPDWSVRSLGRD